MRRIAWDGFGLKQATQWGLSFSRPLAGNFRDNWDPYVDSVCSVWQSDNDDDGNGGGRINSVMEYGNYGYRVEITGMGWRDKRSNICKFTLTRTILV